MSNVMIPQQIIRDALAMVHEAIGEEALISGYGYDQYNGLLAGPFLNKYFGEELMHWCNTSYSEGMETLFLRTVQYKRDKAYIPHPNNVRTNDQFVIKWVMDETKDGTEKHFFPIGFYYKDEPYELKDFIDGTPLPWDRQGEVCTQSTHSTNPLATMENALNQADFKRKEEVMRKFKAFSSALMKSDFVPPWDLSVER